MHDITVVYYFQSSGQHKVHVYLLWSNEHHHQRQPGKWQQDHHQRKSKNEEREEIKSSIISIDAANTTIMFTLHDENTHKFLSSYLFYS